MSKVAWVVVGLLVALSACAKSDGSDPKAACRMIREYGERGKNISVEGRPEYVLAKTNELAKRIDKTGPPKIAEAFAVLVHGDHDSVEVAEQKRISEATNTINSWIRDECGLTVEF